MRESPMPSKRFRNAPAGPEPLFQPIINAFSKDKQVTLGGRFGSVSLKCNGKVFAMLVKGKFVVKLPKERVAQLVATVGATHFDPGHGRLMKEWVAFSDNRRLWIDLAKEARRFVEAANPTKRTAKRKMK